MKRWITTLFDALGSNAMVLTCSSLLGAWVLIAALIPQGWWAEELLRHERYLALRPYAQIGLTDSLSSGWLKALVALSVGSLVCAALRTDAPTSVRRVFDLRVTRPDQAVDVVQTILRPWFGAPVRVEAEGARSRFGYRARAGSAILPIHVGLALVFVGALMAIVPGPRSEMVVRAWLQVRDPGGGAIGVFDMVEGEEQRFFQSNMTYRLMSFTPDRLGLGPAIQLQAQPPSGPSEAFWLFEDADPGFDARHRQGQVEFQRVSIQLQPKPGFAFSGTGGGFSPVLLIAGLTVMGLGVLSVGRPGGRWTVELIGARAWVIAETSPGGEERFFHYTHAALENLAATEPDRFRLKRTRSTGLSGRPETTAT
ncbi:MAG: hypothetical protein ACFB9M_07895 [Myxococcota bacterium]